MTDCTSFRLVDAHFGGTIAFAEERTLREHLLSCALCRARYERRMLLARLDPQSLSARERIGRPLGFVAAARSRVTYLFVAAAAVAIAAAIALFVVPDSRDREFAARGATSLDAPARIQIFTMRPDERGTPTPQRAGATLRRNDELAFSYENTTDSGFLLVFGVDEHGHVFWYHPAWTDAAQDPRAVSIVGDGKRHELKEAISHQLDGGTLEIHALFSKAPLTVRSVEATLTGRKAPLGALAVPGATDYRETFTVLP